MDRRTTPGNERIALESLRGLMSAALFVKGEAARVAVPLVDLCASAAGARDRQLLLGDEVSVIERREGWAFIQAAKDGYCGYLPEAALGPGLEATHWLSAPASHLYPEPRVQAHESAQVSFGARLRVTGQSERFAETPDGYIPLSHLLPLGQHLDGPVAVATMFLGTPYLWGGNSRAGIDCSGLVQAALMACGKDCPRDSDQQAEAVGTELAADAVLQPGDLIFWRGHVAMVADRDRVIHATGHVMAVIFEPIDAAIARIAAAGYPVTRRRRP